jgi:hypothetical protein
MMTLLEEAEELMGEFEELIAENIDIQFNTSYTWLTAAARIRQGAAARKNSQIQQTFGD